MNLPDPRLFLGQLLVEQTPLRILGVENRLLPGHVARVVAWV